MYGVYGCFEVRCSFSIWQRIDHLNAHKATNTFAADMDIVSGLHIVKTLVLRQLGADAVGRHGLLCVIVAPSRIGFVDRLGAGLAVGFEADVSSSIKTLNGWSGNSSISDMGISRILLKAASARLSSVWNRSS